MKFFYKSFHQNDKTRDFDAASSTACTGTDEHEHHQNGSGNLRPQIEVCSREASGGDDGCHLKSRVVESLGEVVVNIPQAESDGDCCRQNNSDIEPDFRRLEGLTKFFVQQQK